MFLFLFSMTLAPQDDAAEATRLTRKTVETFYDAKSNAWKPLVASSESVGRQGYTFWSCLLAWQAIIEAAKVDPKAWKDEIATFYDALEPYYDRKAHAYCAWRYFVGNDDRFYDDNAWASIALMEAYAVTRKPRYRARAIEIFEGFIEDAWDPRGGLRWGTKLGIEDRKDRTVSATAAAALAALLIAPTRDGTAKRAWARRALDWVRTHAAPNGLIRDGVKDDGTEMETIWTYNTGVPIRAALEYARQTGSRKYREWAVRMGDAAINRTQAPLYDGAVADLSKRYWYDGTYFVHYLVDGLRAMGRATGDPRYLAEARREADYVRVHLRDTDGLYWRNMRLWMIDAVRHADYRRLTGTDAPALTPDPSERSQEASELLRPVGERPLVKTLLANAGAARMFWILAGVEARP